MKLHAPFIISARLAPAVNVGDATLSFDGGSFVLDFADGTSHTVEGFGFPALRDPCERLQSGFAAILSFLAACAESRKHGLRRYGDPMRGENSDLFPENVGEWAEQNSDEISMLSYELEESETCFIEE